MLLATLAETYAEVLDELVRLLDQALAGADTRAATVRRPPVTRSQTSKEGYADGDGARAPHRRLGARVLGCRSVDIL